jgi:RNA-directed DNA polymerase
VRLPGATHLVITGKTKELLEGEIKPLVEQFLRERGLELSPMKTVVTQVKQGFDFLGQNVRRYPNEKLLINPSKKNVKRFLAGIRETIKAALGRSAADLINELNPKIRGWANYHRHVVSKRTFDRVDHLIFYKLWQWARRRHPKKDPSWLKRRYFERYQGRDWIFFGETCDEEGQLQKLRLLFASRIPIKRHVKVKSGANPYDPACETYFEKRDGDHMRKSFRGTQPLRFLWYEQRGFCPVCNTKITRTMSPVGSMASVSSQAFPANVGWFRSSMKWAAAFSWPQKNAFMSGRKPQVQRRASQPSLGGGQRAVALPRQ